MSGSSSEEPGRTPVATLVEASDPLSLAGLRSAFAGLAEFELVASRSMADVAVLSVSRLDEEAHLAVKHLHRAEGLTVLLVTDFLDEAGLLRAVEHGVSGVLHRRDASADTLRKGVVDAMAGHGTMSPSMLGRLLHAVQHVGTSSGQNVPSAMIEGLSDREQEVVRLLAEGYDTVQVANALSYSPRTIKNIVHDITVRLSLRNRTHLVAYAVRHQLI